ncbi:hypothetical protein NPIL_92631 [Nephila pilipes]|uniref:Uncharacterized protein n=1 Tax=Nephila pilipes TaxID=299642 RepID=A0A8X6PAV0_NEPPI|nr:hypothetical protein NPIL_92631 [Nephila pilipes]
MEDRPFFESMILVVKVVDFERRIILLSHSVVSVGRPPPFFFMPANPFLPLSSNDYPTSFSPVAHTLSNVLPYCTSPVDVPSAGGVPRGSLARLQHPSRMILVSSRSRIISLFDQRGDERGQKWVQTSLPSSNTNSHNLLRKKIRQI